MIYVSSRNAVLTDPLEGEQFRSIDFYRLITSFFN